MIKKIRDIVSLTQQRPRFLIDTLKVQFRTITKFFDYMTDPFINAIRPFRDVDIAISSLYNKFLENIENDINILYSIQGEIRDNILSSWNVVENSYPTNIQPYDPYDNDFLLEHDTATVVSDRITLGVKNFASAVPTIKGKPIMDAKCSEKSIPVYYGKAWGVYVPSNESGEDGIRVENNDGGLIIDEKDTFWEAEAVVLQGTSENTKLLQPVVDKDISLTATIKFMFKEPTTINTLTLRPYNAAASAYYKLVGVEVSDGTRVVPINIKETFVMRETIFVLDIPDTIPNRKIRSLTLSIKQDAGYFMKYTLGYFKIKNTESWIDVTGSHVAAEAKKMGGNFNTNVSTLIESAGDWILKYWLPNIFYKENPIIDRNQGDNGFLLVPSTESKRKRYTIGITDVIVGSNDYFDTSEKVTKEIDIPEGKNTVSISSSDAGDALYYISVNNGMSWNRILPIEHPNEYNSDLRAIPKKLYINSDLSLDRIKNTITGESAFLFTSSKKIRVRFVLQKNTNNDVLPSIFNWDLVWSRE